MDQAADTFAHSHEAEDRTVALLATLATFCAGDLSVRMPASQDARSEKLNAAVDDWLATVSGVLTEFSSVVNAITEGRLDQPMPIEINGHPLRGPLLQLAERINRMRAKLACLPVEVGRITREVSVEGRLGGRASLPDSAGVWRDLVDSVNRLTASVSGQVRAVSDIASAMAKGDLSEELKIEAEGELAVLRDNINTLIRSLRDTTRRNAEQDWLKTNLARFTRLLQGQRGIVPVAQLVMSELASLIRMQHGLFYVMDQAQLESRCLRLSAAYAAGDDARSAWRLGEGLVGQCALDRKPHLVADVPPTYLTIRTGVGAAAPACLLVQPIVFENEVKAVLELASFTPFSTTELNFLGQLGECIGVVLHTIEASTRTENLLSQAQSLAQELQSQQEALSRSNADLQEKALLLERQKAAMQMKNQEVELTRMSLEEKAEQLTLSSRYKSEFLSSMSHELRTPLNSLLILARQLANNHDNNLSPREVEYAQTIYSAGGDLLNLINEILDLAKIESGTVKLDQRDVAFDDIEAQLLRMFTPIAQSRGLRFEIRRGPGLPASLLVDATRLLQVIRNLLSNSFKFTEHGSVVLSITPATSGWTAGHEFLDTAGLVVAFQVSDTGIGMAAEQSTLIFEPFRQVDTGTSRRYGGTGLGLSISTGLARLMRGELRLLASEPGAGSSFALYVALQPPLARRALNALDDFAAVATTSTPAMPDPGDDRHAIRPGDTVVLAITGDPPLGAATLAAARRCGARGIVARRGSDATALLRDLAPAVIVLDARLPDMDSWMLLATLKRDPLHRHHRVQMICEPGDAMRSLQAGACGWTSPAAAAAIDTTLPALLREAGRKRRLLLIGDDPALCKNLRERLDGADVRLRICGIATLPKVMRQYQDCLVLHVPDTDMDAALALTVDAMRRHGRNAHTPLLLYMPGGATPGQRVALRGLEAHALVRFVHSEQRLLDDVALLLHWDLAAMPAPSRAAIDQLYQGSAVLAGRRVLVVDDDVRNIFALTGLLEHHGMEVCSAESGRAAVDVLHQLPGIDIVLMDIMMPDMDGFDTMRHIRQLPGFDDLPIIAVTAKAMHGDRDKCLSAGASDYVSKPVDVDELLALMRRWLQR